MIPLWGFVLMMGLFFIRWIDSWNITKTIRKRLVIMEIIRGNRVRFNTPSNTYQVTVQTTDGDGIEDFEKHSIKLQFPNTEDGLSQLRETIIALECCSKQYVDGKGMDDIYDGLPFFNRRLRNKWHNSDWGVGQDLFRSYKVRYYDEDGVQFKVSITNDEEMIETITNCEVRTFTH